MPKRDGGTSHPCQESPPSLPLCLSCLSPPRRLSSLHLLGFCQPFILLSLSLSILGLINNTGVFSLLSRSFPSFPPTFSTEDRVSPVYTCFTSPSDITRGKHQRLSTPSSPTNPAVTRIERDDDYPDPPPEAATHRFLSPEYFPGAAASRSSSGRGNFARRRRVSLGQKRKSSRRFVGVRVTGAIAGARPAATPHHSREGPSARNIPGADSGWPCWSPLSRALARTCHCKEGRLSESGERDSEK